MKLFTYIGLLLCVQLPVDLSAQYTFRHVYGGEGNDEARSIIQTKEGGYAVVGSTSSFGYGNADVYFLKLDSMGMYEWSRVYGGPDVDRGYEVEQTTDGGYAIAGYTNSFGNGGYDCYLVKTDSTGVLEWDRTYGGENWDLSYSLELTADSGYILCGETYSYGAGKNDVYLIRTDPNGDTLWTRSYGTAEKETGWSVKETYDSRIVMAGVTTNGQFNKEDAYILFADASGTLVWQNSFGGNEFDIVKDITETYDSTGFIAVGASASISPGSTKRYIVKTDYSGAIVWQNYFGLNDNETGHAIDHRNSNAYIITGETDEIGTDIEIDAFGADGSWWDDQTFGGSSRETALSIEHCNDNGFIICGTTNSFGSGYDDILVMKTDSDIDTDSTTFTAYPDTSVVVTTKTYRQEKHFSVNNSLAVFPVPAPHCRGLRRHRPDIRWILPRWVPGEHRGGLRGGPHRDVDRLGARAPHVLRGQRWRRGLPRGLVHRRLGAPGGDARLPPGEPPLPVRPRPPRVQPEAGSVT